MQFASRFNEISDDCCGKFVVDFAEMASAHDTVSDVSNIGAEIDDSSDYKCCMWCSTRIYSWAEIIYII